MEPQKRPITTEKRIILLGCFGLLGITLIGCFVGDYFFKTKLLDDALLHTIIAGVLGFLAAHAGKKQESE